MTTLYLLTPGLFVDKPFCQNLLVKGGSPGAPEAHEEALILSLPESRQQPPPPPGPSVTNQPPNGQEAPLGMGI